MKRKLVFLLLATTLILGGCGGTQSQSKDASQNSETKKETTIEKESETTSSTEKDSEVVNTEALSENEITSAYSDPDSYKGRKLTITLKTIADPEHGDDGYLYIQGCRNTDAAGNYIDYTAVQYPDNEFTYTNGDTISVTGTISGAGDVDNTSYLCIVADSIEVTEHIYTKEEMQSLCKEYTYDELVRNTDSLYGELIRVTAKIAQVLKDDNGTYYDAAIDADADGIYESEICLIDSRSEGENLLEDDIITAYGAVSGETEFERLTGEKVYVPQIQFLYCDRIN